MFLVDCKKSKNNVNKTILFFILFVFLGLVGCAAKHKPIRKLSRKLSSHNIIKKDGPPTQVVDVSKIQNAIPKIEPKSRYGNPRSYVALGKRYHVLPTAKGYDKVGYASWYGMKFHGKLTSTREPYDLYAMTAASTDLPLPTYVRVTNLENGRSIIVRVNDRGPFKHKRILDLSYAAAKKLGYIHKGTARVRVTAIDPRLWAKRHINSAIPRSDRVFAQKTTKLAQIPSPVYLQVGAFGDKKNAQRVEWQLRQFVNAPIQLAVGSKLYRVQIGPLSPNTEKTAYLRRLLSERGFNSSVIAG